MAPGMVRNEPYAPDDTDQRQAFEGGEAAGEAAGERQCGRASVNRSLAPSVGGFLGAFRGALGVALTGVAALEGSTRGGGAEAQGGMAESCQQSHLTVHDWDPVPVPGVLGWVGFVPFWEVSTMRTVKTTPDSRTP